MILVKTVNEGVLLKGMPAWSPILGQAKISEVVAYILSFHHEGEPAEIKPWIPVTVPATAAN